MRSMFTRLSVLAFVGAISASPMAVASPTACGDKTSAPNKVVPADAAKVELTVVGMSCDGCANALHNALLATEGVFTADVSFASGKAAVSYDAKKLKVDDLIALVSKAGYKATAGKS